MWSAGFSLTFWLFASQAAAYPALFGEGAEEQAECGVLPVVGETYKPHEETVEDLSTDLVISDPDGNELNQCFLPGGEHTIKISFGEKRHAAIYITGDTAGGVFESDQDEFPANIVDIPDDCEDTRRTMTTAEETWTLTYLAAADATELTVALVSGMSPPSAHQRVSLTISPCETEPVGDEEDSVTPPPEDEDTLAPPPTVDDDVEDAQGPEDLDYGDDDVEDAQGPEDLDYGDEIAADEEAAGAETPEAEAETPEAEGPDGNGAVSVSAVASAMVGAAALAAMIL